MKDEKDAMAQNMSMPMEQPGSPGPQMTQGPVNMPGQALAGRVEPQ